MGDLDGAEEALQQASEMGVPPQPGLALVLVQRGRPEAAARALRRALAGTSLQPLDRAKLLPAQLDVALLLGDVDTARLAATELDTIANAHTAPALRATADAGAAAVALVDGALGEAELAANHARALFDEVDLSYESARVSVLLGQIHQAQGNADGARVELTAGLTALEGIGAIPDAIRARDLLHAV
jgi:ATP/maltotriose-dependent transcriptional regulator MalT